MRRAPIFWRPALLTLALHGLLVVALLTNWSAAEEPAMIAPPVPRYIEARLVTVTPEPQVSKQKALPEKVATKPSPKPKPKPQPKPKPAPEPKPEVAPQPVAEAEPEPESTPQPRTAMDDLQIAMAEEEEDLAALTDVQRTASYIALIASAVEANWSRPPSARNGMEAELLIQLIPNGKVVSVSLARSSGSAAFDNSAVSAVERAAAFPELKNLESRLFEQNFRRLRLKFKPEDLRY
ncbi:MAG: TonB family protein [Pseudomonadota bacterium]